MLSACDRLSAFFGVDELHPHGVQQQTALAARSRAEVDASHAAAMKKGGTDNGAPGVRDINQRLQAAKSGLCSDKNNVESVFRGG